MASITQAKLIAPLRPIERWLILAAALLLTGLLVHAALTDPAAPHVAGSHPEGWWGWWDQSQTLKSAQALAAFDLRPERHWYPLGYSILLAAASPLGRDTGVLVIDTACLVITLLTFVAVARRTGVPPLVALPVFLAALLLNADVFRQWVVPWNTTPVAALVWSALYLLGRRIDGRDSAIPLGVVAGLIPLFRPTEAYVSVICGAAMLVSDWRSQRPLWRSAGGFVLGVLLAVLPYALLHVAIYGAAAPSYMRHSGDVGFTTYDFAWKAYVVLSGPGPWFTGSHGLIQGCPWILLGIAGLLPALRRGAVPAALACVVTFNTLLYVTYIDLLPTGLWAFLNVHYWIWALPGDALLAVWLLADLASRRARFAWAALAATLALSCIRITPRPVALATSAKAVDYRGAPPGLFESYFAEFRFRDDRGELDNMADVRAFPTAEGMRVVALRRPINGALQWLNPIGALVPAERLGMRVSLGLPHW